MLETIRNGIRWLAAVLKGEGDKAVLREESESQVSGTLVGALPTYR
ncbi:MAG: hypothetical protein QHH04_03345 [Methanolinea sp.]|jgi:hypothetical protein|nr:hypothetical protein [Methanolinea sp.]